MSLFLILIIGCKKEEDVKDNLNFALPEVNTLSIIQVGRLFKIKGYAISASSSPIIEKGICYDTIGIPTIENSRNFSDTDFNTTDRRIPGYFTIKLKDLKAGTNYFVRAYATNKDGTAYGGTLKLTTESLSNLVVGDNYGGGQIAYFLEQGDPGFIAGEIHGIAVAPYDQSDSALWGGDMFDGIGAGILNTFNSVNKKGVIETACRICYDLELNGFNDWYLPSNSEFHLIVRNRDVLNNFVIDKSYWSSTDFNHPFSWPNGPYFFTFKKDKVESDLFPGFRWQLDYFKMRVRAIRLF